VSGIVSSNQGRAFKNIIQELSESGYELTIHKYKFEEYGVPQSRHRIIIVGFRNDLGIKYKVPAPSFKKVSAKEALDNIPINALNHELVMQHPRVVERLNYIKPGKNAWNSYMPKELRLKSTLTTLSNIYRRLVPDQPAYTVTGSGGGGTYMYHWSENRALTNRERARLQTFPDWFHFSGLKNSVRKQIGMSIPVVAGTTIVTSVLDTLIGKSYESVDANMNIS
jgi:DNA (cytosine-5)-methyltransferase 1